MDEVSVLKFRKKIKTAEELRAIVGPMPREKKVIMCHGHFDIVHPGHLRHLIYAKSKADILVASLTADKHIVKANTRPYVPEDLRAINLAAFEIVDYVLIDHEAKPIRNIELIQPNYFAKGYEYVKGDMNPKTQEEIDTLERYGGEMIFTPGDIVYSSSHLLELAPPNIAVEKLMMLMQGESITFDTLRQAIARMNGLKAHVIGDTIVDSYTQCSMIGGQTKTPTMSVRFEERLDYVGGAAVVAKHLRAAGADVVFSTVLGDDALRDFVLDDLKQQGVTTRAIIDPTRPTTNKNAIVVGGYRLLKIDTLDNRSISDKVLRRLAAQIEETDSAAVVFADFRHGIFNKTTIPDLVGSIPAAAFKVADSQVASRWGNILEFQGFDLITPNEREARFALGDQDSIIRPLGSELYRRANCKTLMLKLGDRGMITFRTGGYEAREFFTVESFADNAVDPVGAGDALLSYATLSLMQDGNPAIASILGAFAAGIECEHDGNIPVTPEMMLAKIAKVERQVNFA